LRTKARKATRIIIVKFIGFPGQIFSADFADYTDDVDALEVRLSETPLQPTDALFLLLSV